MTYYNFSYDILEQIHLSITYFEPITIIIIIIIFIVAILFMNSLRIELLKYRTTQKWDNSPHMKLTPLEWYTLFKIQNRGLRTFIAVYGLQNSLFVQNNMPEFKLAYDEAMTILHRDLELMGGSISILKGTLSMTEEMRLMKLIAKTGRHFSVIV